MDGELSSLSATGINDGKSEADQTGRRKPDAQSTMKSESREMAPPCICRQRAHCKHRGQGQGRATRLDI